MSVRADAEREEETVMVTNDDGARAERQLELLRRLTNQRQGRLLGAPDLPGRRPREVPLAWSQRRLWLVHQLGGGGDYNIAHAIRLRGQLDHAALAAAIDAVAMRHEALRTTFVPTEDGDAWQYIHTEVPAGSLMTVVACTEEDLPGRLASAATEPFDLRREVPFSAVLFGIHADESVLLLRVHHIACDGWSVSILLSDLGSAYQDLRQGHEPRWDPLSRQYADYALDQRLRLGDPDDPSSEAAGQLGFWESALRDVPAQTRIPPVGPPGAHNRAVPHPSAVMDVHIDADLSSRLLTLAAASSATTFMVLQSALAAVIGRAAASEDVLLGTATFGRDHDGLSGIVGCFVNTIVLRNDLRGDPSFRDLVARIRDFDVAAFAHQDVPFEHVVRALNPPRAAGVNPLFQISLSSDTDASFGLTLDGLHVTSEPLPAGAAPFDLSFVFGSGAEADGRIAGSVRYRADLYTERTIEALVTEVVSFLDSAALNPGASISAHFAAPLRLSREQEDDGHAAEQTLIELFQQSLERHPDSSAIACGPRRLTYRELDHASSRLAHRLTASGIRSKDLICVMLPRSEHLIVAMLAAMRIGSVYVPVDVAHPDSRKAAILRDSRARIAIINPEHAGLVRDSGIEPLTVGLMQTSAPVQRAPEHQVATNFLPSPSETAYVIYTSGTTGAPKGVAVSHRAAALLTTAQVRILDLDKSSRVLQFASCGFDASISEIWTSLCAGSTLVIPEMEEPLIGPTLARVISSNQITHLTLPPIALLETDFNEEDVERITLISAGEPCTPAVIAATSRFGRVFNAYGPTEAAVCATMCELSDVMRRMADSSAPLGKPLPHVTVHVLDARLMPVEPGAEGEIYVAGPALAEGYLHEPGLTATRFVPSPFGPPGARLYRTGDLAISRADGELDFVGRVDDQVKIRGHRVEPAEVKDRLLSHPDIRAAEVMSAIGPHGLLELRAFAVLTTGGVEDATKLRQYLVEQLPSAIVPTVVSIVSQIPMTLAGKVDRFALLGGTTQAAPSDAPRDVAGDAAECRDLQDLFAEFLGVPNVGPDDSFFDLGGHSVLAVRLIRRVSTLFGREVGVTALFDATTPASLAKVLTRAPQDPYAQLIELRSGTQSDRPIFLVHPMGGLAWCYRTLLPYIDQTRPVYGIQVTDGTGRLRRAHSWADLVERYGRLIRNTAPGARPTLAGWSLGGCLAYDVACHLRELESDVETLVLLDSRPYTGAASSKPPSHAIDKSAAADQIDEVQRETLVDAMSMLRDVVQAPAHSRFDGRTTCISADQTEDHLGPASDVWTPFLANVHYDVVHSSHDAMMSAEVVRELGPLVRAATEREPGSHLSDVETIAEAGPDPDGIAEDERRVFIRTRLRPGSAVTAGAYAYYDASEDETDFETARVLYAFGDERLIIGRYCAIAAGVRFMMPGANHALGGPSTYPFHVFRAWTPQRALAEDAARDTVIGNDVWIGREALILPGVTIGDGAIVGAGAVVSGAIPAYSVVVGNPARVARMRFSDDDIARMLEAQWWNWPAQAVDQHIPVIIGGTPDQLVEIARREGLTQGNGR